MNYNQELVLYFLRGERIIEISYDRFLITGTSMVFIYYNEVQKN